MEAYLHTAKTNLNQLEQFQIVKVVIGNEACDLDSAVSAIMYGCLLHEEAKLIKNERIAVLSVLNIPQSELPLKTEVMFWLKENHVSLDDLIYRDQIDVQSLHSSGQLQLILVDRHTLPPEVRNLQEAVVEVIDHRPQEVGWEWTGRKITLMKVGSCCSLVAREIILRNKKLITQQAALLLYGPIIIDTACLSVSAGRTEQLDLDIIHELENKFGNAIDRKKIFQRLIDARTDITGLTSSQLLIRDLKVVNGVPICGLPILVQEFINLPDVETALRNFCAQRKVSTAVLMGLHVKGTNVTRDIAVFSSAEHTVAQELIDFLKNSENPPLELKQTCMGCKTAISGLTVFQQGNIQASRKQILPIVKAASQSIQGLGRTTGP